MRGKYRCKCGHIEAADGAAKLTPGGRYSIDFAIHVILSRYSDLIPVDRLRKMMKRAGLNITSQALWDQIQMVSNLLAPAKARLMQTLQSGDVLLADETRWPLLGARSGKQKRSTENWYIWAIVGKEGVVYEIQDSRSNQAGATVLANYKGVVIADGYVVYRSLANRHAFTLAHDWTHVRRKFLEAEDSDPDLAVLFIEEIGKLFLIERNIAAAVKGLPEEDARALCAQVRAEHSKPIVARVGQRAVEVRSPKESPIAQALTYLENRWKGLQVFLTNPDVPITSNGVERALRPPVVARKVTLGSRSEKGIVATSVLTTLLESAKLLDRDQAYLRAAVLAAKAGEVIPLPHEFV